MTPRGSLGRIGEGLPSLLLDADLLLTPGHAVWRLRWLQAGLPLSLRLGSLLDLPDRGSVLSQVRLPGINGRRDRWRVVIGAWHCRAIGSQSLIEGAVVVHGRVRRAVGCARR